jgi:2-polyprenyl-6-hydroxyphenyl methylase/3-demethylubiquinone-9 3-methyltransferase
LPDNHNPIARLATITVAEDISRLLPKDKHDPAMFIKPHELCTAMTNAGLVCGPQTGLGPRSVNKRLDFKFGPLPFKTIIYMGTARLPNL